MREANKLTKNSPGLGNHYASEESLMYEEGFLGRVRRIAFTSLFLMIFGAFAPQITRAASSVTLEWDASPSAGVAGYNIYYGIASGNYTNMVTAGNATNVIISGLINGVTYYFAATAYDSFGIESDYSSETNYAPAVTGNEAPTLNAIANLTINEDAAQQTISLAGISSGSPAEVQTLTVTAVSGNTSVIPNPSITYTSPNTTGSLRFTPVANMSGTATITVTVNDNQTSNNIAVRTFNVTVAAVNDAPTISAIANQTTLQDTPTAAIPFTVGDIETPAGSLTLSSASSNPSLIAQSGIGFGGSGASRTVTLTPAPGQGGTANITVSVSDGSTSRSSTFQLTVTATVPPTNAPTVTVTVTGGGKVTPTLSPAKVVRGKTYTFTATPNAGQVFAGWSGSISSMEARLTLKVTNDVVLQANFVASPYIPIAGTYNGLFHESDLVRQTSSGGFALSITTKGTYSGKVQIGSLRHSFSGKLALNVRATNLVIRPKNTPLMLHVRIGTNSELDQLFGDLSDGSWVASISGDRSRFNAKTNAAAAAGSYTFVLPGAFNSSLPQGHSIGTVKVTTAGRITFAGSLADGSRVSQGATLSKNNNWPLYLSLYSGKGSILSWMNFSDLSSSDIAGDISWIKLADAKAKYFSSGFQYLTSAAGSAYHPPASPNEHIINADYVAVDFSGGNLPSDFSNMIALGANSKVTNMGNNKLGLAFGLSTGLYKGTVTDPNSGKSSAFTGAVFQKTDFGFGYLLGTNRSSRVDLSP